MGMEELVNLKYLDLSPARQVELAKPLMGTNFFFPVETDVAMSENWRSRERLAPCVKITAGKVANLMRLEYIYSWFGNVGDLNEFVASRGREFLPYYFIIVGAFMNHSTTSAYGFSRDARAIVLAGVDTGGELIQLPSNVVELEIISVKGGPRCLNDFISITSLGEATDLRYLGISYCGDMECMFSAGYPQINNLSTLRLLGLCKLTAVCSPCSSTCMLSSLARIHISGCNKLKELFSYDCLPHNLEVINVRNCTQMEEIVTWEEGSRIASGSSDTTQTQLLCLPKLKKLQLMNLPRLKSIFPERRITIASDALKKIQVSNCQLLRRVPLHLPLLLNDQPSALPYLREVLIHPLEWWHWGHPNAKAVLRPFLRHADPKRQWEICPVEQDILDASAATWSSGQM